MREFLLAKAESLLQSKEFEVSDFAHSNTCFDIAAKKGKVTLLLKVFENIDSLREEHAFELKKLVTLFNAVVMVLGTKTKAFTLKKGVIYERYGIPAISVDSFAGILDKKFPSVKSFKGREIVELETDLLKQKRKELGLTLSELASKIGSTTESIHRYEKGHSTSLQTAEKLEEALNARLVKKIDLFEEAALKQNEIFEEEIEDPALEKVQGLGLKLALFKHAPFKAGSGEREHLVIAKGTSKQDVKRKAIELGKTGVALGSHGMVITKKAGIRSVGKIPIIEEDELTTLSRFNDLMKLLREREKERVK